MKSSPTFFPWKKSFRLKTFSGTLHYQRANNIIGCEMSFIFLVENRFSPFRMNEDEAIPIL